jgi:DNA-binding transcriptional ArsR family regulator
MDSGASIFNDMEIQMAAKQLEALGNTTRLAIYRDLIQAGQQGRLVGEIRDKLDIPASTLSHHISKLMVAGLITQERVSRSLVCRADFHNMDALMIFLVQNCCSEDSCMYG